MSDYTYTADDFDLEAEFRAVLNYGDEFDTESEWTRDSGFMTDDEVHGLQVKHAKRARQELERLMSTDNANRDMIAAIVNANPDFDFDPTSPRWNQVGDVKADEDLPDDNTGSIVDWGQYFVGRHAAWSRGFNPAKFADHVEASAKARRYHGIEDLVLNAAGQVRSTKQRRRPAKRLAKAKAKFG